MKIQPNKYNPTEKTDRNKKIFDLKAKGYSQNQIAGIVGTTDQNVRRILKLHAGKYGDSKTSTNKKLYDFKKEGVKISPKKDPLYFSKLEGLLDEYFPKGKSKARPEGLMLFAMAILLHEESLALQRQEIITLYNNHHWDGLDKEKVQEHLGIVESLVNSYVLVSDTNK